MRIMNLNDLRGDINFYFRGQDEGPLHEQFMAWVMKSWTKHFIRTQQGFLHEVTVRGLPSFFKTEDVGTDRLMVELESGEQQLEPQTEWDMKDAAAGTLLYFSPTKQTLFKYTREIISVRDYIFDLLSTDPETDLLKRSFEDTKRASDKWHEEQRKRLQARLEAEAEARRATMAAQAEAKLDSTDWSKMTQGIDFWPALEQPFIVGGKKYALIRLGTQKTLTYEAFIMDHCVDGYGLRIMDGKTVILSVRALDSLNTPLITAELYAGPACDPYFVQIQGQSNHDPEETIPGISTKLKALIPELIDAAKSPLSQYITFRVSNARH